MLIFLKTYVIITKVIGLLCRFLNFLPTEIFVQNAINPFALFVDADLNMDFNFSNQQFFHMMDLAFTGGMKFYPGLGGFAFGIGYSIGTRFNYTNDIIAQNYVGKNDWGNGFKLFLEYNFSYNSSYRFLPTLGVSWRLMPRGNNFYDNIFSFYLMMNF